MAKKTSGKAKPGGDPPKATKPIKCPKCSKPMNPKSGKHGLSYVCNNFPKCSTVKCSTCDYTSSSIAPMGRHLKEKHQNEIVPVTQDTLNTIIGVISQLLSTQDPNSTELVQNLKGHDIKLKIALRMYATHQVLQAFNEASGSSTIDKIIMEKCADEEELKKLSVFALIDLKKAMEGITAKKVGYAHSIIDSTGADSDQMVRDFFKVFESIKVEKGSITASKAFAATIPDSPKGRENVKDFMAELMSRAGKL